VTTIVDKDLFDPSRQKPTEEVKAAPVKEVGPPPNLTLVGVRMIGRDREVFVTDAAQADQQKRLRIGDQIGGYTLKTVAPSKVTLASASGETIDLNLAVDKSGGGGPPGGISRPPGAATPPRPGQPAGLAAPSPAAGIQPRPPGAPGVPGVAPGGVQPRPPRAAVPGARPGVPSPPGVPPAAPPTVPQRPGAVPGAAGVPGAQAAPPPYNNPNLPAAVREKLEQLKGN
jgi:hypothetical protein